MGDWRRRQSHFSKFLLLSLSPNLLRMNFYEYVAVDTILSLVVLLWATWSKLDLGLRSPIFREAWRWIALFVAWIGIEAIILWFHPFDLDPRLVDELERFTFAEKIVIIVLLGPFFEELLFRGAMFAALLRRWGIWPAIIVPSVLWGLLHTQYEFWFVCSIIGSGVILAVIRWKTDSLYVPLVLHAGYNLYTLWPFPD